MKKYILLLGVFYISSICFAQNTKKKNSITLCYEEGNGSLIGGKNHCITIWFESDSIFFTRRCYVSNRLSNCIDTTVKQNTELVFDYSFKIYYESYQKMIWCQYQKNDRYLILDERVPINKSQFDDFVKIINEIKVFASKINLDTTEITFSTSRNYYVIQDKNEISVIIDLLGNYYRREDIEKVFGLKHHSRCPCVEIEIMEARERLEIEKRDRKNSRIKPGKRVTIP